MLHRYAAYYIHQDSGIKTALTVETVKEYRPGDSFKTWNGDTILIDFEFMGGKVK